MRSGAIRVGLTGFVLVVSFILAPLAEGAVSVYKTVNRDSMREHLSIEVSAVVTDSQGFRQAGVLVIWVDQNNLVTFASPSTITDGNGRTQNTAQGQGIQGLAVIIADAGAFGAGQATLTLTSTTPNCNSGTVPFIPTWKSDHPCNMVFQDNSSFQDERATVVTEWNDKRCDDGLPHIRFLEFPQPTGLDITIQDTCIPNGYFGQTEKTDGSFIVRLNLWQLDGFLTTPGSACWSDLPGDSDFIRKVISHELGHTLALGHNTTGTSLMTQGSAVWFLCGINGPVSPEMTRICNEYTNACN